MDAVFTQELDAEARTDDFSVRTSSSPALGEHTIVTTPGRETFNAFTTSVPHVDQSTLPLVPDLELITPDDEQDEQTEAPVQIEPEESTYSSQADPLESPQHLPTSDDRDEEPTGMLPLRWFTSSAHAQESEPITESVQEPVTEEPSGVIEKIEAFIEDVLSGPQPEAVEEQPVPEVPSVDGSANDNGTIACADFADPALLHMTSAKVGLSLGWGADHGMLLVEYSVDGKTWHNAGQITGAREEGAARYDEIALPNSVLAKLDSLRIRLHWYGDFTDPNIFLDSLWIDVAGEVPSAEEVAPTIEASESTFDAGSEPDFDLTLTPHKLGFADRLFSVIRPALAEGGEQQETWQEPDAEVVATVLDAKREPTNIKPVIRRVGYGKFKVTLEERSFDPGKYTLQLNIKQEGKTFETEKDFTWGVLVVNTDQSVYQSGDVTQLSFGVLNEVGETICDATLVAKITNPLGEISTLSTNDGTIKRSDQCSRISVTDVPDYSGAYTTSEAGTYRVAVTATTTNGSYTISDQFLVQEELVYRVRRVGASRIFPLERYRMTIEVSASERFEGVVSEFVPLGFSVTPSVEFTVAPTSDAQMLVWQTVLEPGEQRTLIYEYDAPDISPEIFLLGKLTFTAADQEVFSETRYWQIASDAVSAAAVTNGTGADSSALSTYATSSVTPTSNRLLLLWVSNTKASTPNTPTVTGNSLTWVEVATVTFASISAPEKRLTLFRAMGTATSGTISIDFGGASQTGCAWTLIEYTNADRSGTNGSGAIVQSVTDRADSAVSGEGSSSGGLSITLASLASANNMTAGGFANAINNAAAITAGSGYTAFTGTAHGSPATSLRSIYDATGSTTVNVAQTANSHIGGIAVEIRNAVITISGTAYTDEGTTRLTTGRTIKLLIDGASSTTTTTSTSSCPSAPCGNFSFSNITASVGSVITLFIDGATENATLVTKPPGTGGDATGLSLYQNRVIVASEDATAVSATDMNQYDGDNEGDGIDGDVGYKVDTSSSYTCNGGSGFLGICISDSRELHVNTGDTFTPGAAVTIERGGSAPGGDLHVVGTMNLPVSDTVSVGGGDISGAGTIVSGLLGTVIVTDTGSLGGGTYTFWNLTLGNGTNGGTTTTAGTLSVAGDLTVAASHTLTGTNDVNVGSILLGTVSGAGTINMTAGTFTLLGYQNEDFGSSSGSNNWTFNNLTFRGDPGTGAARTITTSATGTGQIIVNGTLTIGNAADAHTTTLDNNTNDRIIDANGAVTITSKGALTASSSASFTIAGAFTNSGTFTHSSGSVTFDGTGALTFGATIVFSSVTVSSSTTRTLTSSTSSAKIYIDSVLTANGTLVSADNEELVLQKDGGIPLVMGGSGSISGVAVTYYIATTTTTTVTGTTYGALLVEGNVTYTLNGNLVATSLVVFDTSGGTPTLDTNASSNYSITVNTDLWVGLTFLTLEFPGVLTLNSSTVAVAGNLSFSNDSGATLNAGSSAISVGGNWAATASSVFNAGSGTVTFNATATGKTITSGGDSFNNVIFNGSGGGWTFQTDATTISGDLTLTNGSVNASQNVTVNGNVVGTGGVINITNAVTFEQRVSSAKNFGPTTASTSWTFSTLTFSNSNAGSTPITVTAQSCSTCGVTVTSVLNIGKTGDATGATTTLSAGDKTWTLSGSGTPFVILSSPAGVLTPSTSTFVYTGSSATDVTAATYNNLNLGGSGTTTTYTAAGNITVNGIITIVSSSGTNTFDASSRTITLAGTGTPFVISSSEVFTASTSKIVYSGATTATNVTSTTYNNLDIGGSSTTTTYTLAGDITVGSILAIVSSSGTNTLDGSSRTITLSGTGTPFTVASTEVFTPSTSTVSYTGATTATNIAGTTYYNLNIGGSATTTNYTAAGDLSVGNVLTVVSSSGTNTFDASSRTITITGTNADPFVVNSSEVFTASTSTVVYASSTTGIAVKATTYYNLQFNHASGGWALQGTTTVNNDVLVSAGALSLNEKNFNISHTAATASSGITGSGTIYCGNGDNTCSAGATVFTNTGSGVVGGGTYTFHTLTFTGNSGTTTLGGALTTKHNFVCGNGTSHTCDTSSSGNYQFDPYNLLVMGVAGGTNAIFNANASTITVTGNSFWLQNFFSSTSRGTLNAGSATININGTNNGLIGAFYVANGTFNAGTSTIKYANAATGTAVATEPTYYNLEINGSGTYAIFATLNVSRSLTVTSTLGAGTNNVTVGSTSVTDSGLFKVSGTFTQNAANTTTISSSASSTASCIGSTGASCSGTVGTITFGGLTIGDGSTTMTATFGGTAPSMTIGGVLNITANATFDAGTGSTISLSNATTPITRSGTFTKGTSTVSYTSGSGISALSSAAMTGSHAFYNLTINGTGTFTNGVNAEVTNTLTVTAGTLAGTSDLTVNADVTGAGTINLSGGTFLHRVAAAQMFGSNSGSNNWTFNNLTFENSSSSDRTITTSTIGSGEVIVSGILTIGNASDSHSTTLDNNTNDRILDANGSVTITSKGVLTASSSASFTIAGNLTNSGTFTHSSGTVTFDTTGTSVLTGSATPAIIFHNVTITTPGKIMQFTESETFRIDGAFTVRGSSGSNVVIDSTTSTQWLINHQGTESIEYATISNSGCDGSSTNITVNRTSTDDGNNGSCWLFPNLSLTIDSTSATLALNAGNSYTNTATSTLTVTAAAQFGYRLTAYATGLMTHTNATDTIADWGGTNASPTTWTTTCVGASACGFGYSTDDADLTQFSSTKYAAFTQTAPGDLVAQSSGPATNEATVITYRASVSNVQPAGTYQTVVHYILTPEF